MNNTLAIKVLTLARDTYLWDGISRITTKSSQYVCHACTHALAEINGECYGETSLGALGDKITEAIGGEVTMEDYLRQRKIVAHAIYVQAYRKQLINDLINHYKEQQQCQPYSKLSVLFKWLREALQSKPSWMRTPVIAS